MNAHGRLRQVDGDLLAQPGCDLAHGNRTSRSDAGASPRLEGFPLTCAPYAHTDRSRSTRGRGPDADVDDIPVGTRGAEVGDPPGAVGADRGLSTLVRAAGEAVGQKQGAADGVPVIGGRDVDVSGRHPQLCGRHGARWRRRSPVTSTGGPGGSPSVDEQEHCSGENEDAEGA